MSPDRFVALALLGFGLLIGGFIVRGMSRVFIDARVASVIAAPLILGGFGLIVVLTALAMLAYVGRGPLAGTITRDND